MLSLAKMLSRFQNGNFAVGADHIFQQGIIARVPFRMPTCSLEEMSLLAQEHVLPVAYDLGADAKDADTLLIWLPGNSEADTVGGFLKVQRCCNFRGHMECYGMDPKILR